MTTTWWTGTIALIGVLLVVDLFISGRRGMQSTRQSVRWVIFYIAVALIFGLAIGLNFGASYGGQFLGGWLTEYSLSVDNLFVFLVLMTRFAVPDHLQLRVLTVGVVIALVLRGGLIGLGAVALSRFSGLFYLFGAFLIYTAWSMVRSDHKGEAEAAEDHLDEPDDEPQTVRLLSRFVPNTPVWHGTRLFIRQNGKLLVTPMLLTMLAIGFTDVLFALDSIPAIFGLTQEPFLVITANAFALIGLRQLFFVVRGLLDTLEHLSKGLSLVLAFIGVKLVLQALHENRVPFINGGEHVSWAPEIPTSVSLAVVVGIILLTALTSMIASRRRATREAAEARKKPHRDLDSTRRTAALDPF
ncbi:MAG TPA: TerC/Alx family metal homeostasis membrane protein [Kineosporiaceae bacterium]|nr:TerC/Alx family metal homeostasis membrane protein [Kineosporiaceae bacterium]